MQATAQASDSEQLVDTEDTAIEGSETEGTEGIDDTDSDVPKIEGVVSADNRYWRDIVSTGQNATSAAGGSNTGPDDAAPLPSTAASAAPKDARETDFYQLSKDKTLIYQLSTSSGLQIIDIAKPDAPVVRAQIPLFRRPGLDSHKGGPSPGAAQPFLRRNLRGGPDQAVGGNSGSTQFLRYFKSGRALRRKNANRRRADRAVLHSEIFGRSGTSR